jgi:hypothetical protein
MHAYLFWHRPSATAEAKRYEEALLSFQQRLAERPPPGFRAAGSYRISAVPWLDDRPGYEDWCYVDGSWALDPLNGFAVAGAAKAPHDAAAAQMEIGHGGLYSLAWGTPELTQRPTVTWLTRPRGIDWQAALEPVRAQFPDATCWRRQMVLGPGHEFAVVVPSGRQVVAPSGWTALHVSAVRVVPGS